jgi:hypothetical protein
VKRLRVLDREIVQAKALLPRGQLILIGLKQPDPHEAIAIFLLADLGRSIKIHWAFLLPAAVTVVGTIDNHLEPPPSSQI